MKPHRPTFATMAERRFRLAGKSIIERGHPYFVPVDTRQAECERRNVRYTSFAHYDYLGLSTHPDIVAAAVNALETLGSGAGASRLVGGERAAHAALESDLADFFGFGSALTLVSGYLANVSLISHLMGPRDLVLVDELAHNSIIVGARSGRFDHMVFSHNDLDDLEARLIETRQRYRHVLIVVEGLYSMDGDIPDLPRLIEIKDAHDAWLLLDEAHSYGVLGRTGRGLCEHFGIDTARIEMSVGTLSKAFVSSGGFICASAGVIDWLRFTLPGFVYSVGLSPATLGSAHAALRFLRSHPERVEALQCRSEYFVRTAREAGVNTGQAIGRGVIPVLFENPEQTMAASQALLHAGVYAPPIVQVGIPKDQPRIRFFVSATHTTDDIDRTVAIIAQAIASESGRMVSAAGG